MLFTMSKLPLHIFLSLGFLGLILHPSLAQTDTLMAPPQLSADGMVARMAAPQAAYGEVLQRKALPSYLGGGLTDVYALVVEDVFRKEKYVLKHADFQAENLRLARWMNHRYFLFIATDFVDIIGYYLFDTETDRAIPCTYEAGENLGYAEIDPRKTFVPTLVAGQVVGYTAQ